VHETHIYSIHIYMYVYMYMRSYVIHTNIFYIYLCKCVRVCTSTCIYVNIYKHALEHVEIYERGALLVPFVEPFRNRRTGTGHLPQSFHHPLSPVIKLGFHHPRMKEWKKKEEKEKRERSLTRQVEQERSGVTLACSTTSKTEQVAVLIVNSSHQAHVIFFRTYDSTFFASGGVRNHVFAFAASPGVQMMHILAHEA